MDIVKTFISTYFQDEGRVVHGQQISVLRKKLSDMESSFQEVSAHLDRSLKIAQEEIEQQAQSTLTIQKKIASEEAANSINKDDRQEIADHKWLKKEVRVCVQSLAAWKILDLLGLVLISVEHHIKIDRQSVFGFWAKFAFLKRWISQKRDKISRH